jgi:hypothetical protein
MSNGLAITYCTLLILYFITAIIPEGVPGDIFLIILRVIIGFIFLVQQKNCILAILQDRTHKLQQ